jgi:hypothetical protein
MSGVLRGDRYLDRGIETEPKFAAIQLSATGAVVAAVAGKRIRVLAAFQSASAAVNTKWQSASTDLTGLTYFVADTLLGPQVLPFNPAGWFQTAKGEALNLNLSGSVAVGGGIVYVEV